MGKVLSGELFCTGTGSDVMSLHIINIKSLLIRLHDMYLGRIRNNRSAFFQIWAFLEYQYKLFHTCIMHHVTWFWDSCNLIL